MRRLWCALVILCVILGLTATLSAQKKAEVPNYKWKTYHSAALKLDVSIPPGWHSDTTLATELIFSPNVEEWDEDGLPPKPNPWFKISKRKADFCPTVPTYTLIKGSWSAVVCTKEVEYFFGFWDKDKEDWVKKDLLRLMLERIKTQSKEAP